MREPAPMNEPATGPAKTALEVTLMVLQQGGGLQTRIAGNGPTLSQVIRGALEGKHPTEVPE